VIGNFWAFFGTATSECTLLFDGAFSEVEVLSERKGFNSDDNRDDFVFESFGWQLTGSVEPGKATTMGFCAELDIMREERR
jgi:hypothetical protein